MIIFLCHSWIMVRHNIIPENRLQSKVVHFMAARKQRERWGWGRERETGRESERVMK
jgi:hypothetical protein